MPLITTDTEQQQLATLLAKGTPHYRLAYSDRTAWLMACLSELAYLRFNPLMTETQRIALLQKVDRLLDKPRQAALLALVEKLGYDPDEERQELIQELTLLDGELVATFDRAGTQAILVKLKLGLVLAFRGTEATSIKDIKADADAVSTHADNGGRVHRGFQQAFQSIYMDIKAALANYPDQPLVLTGHSLGGALATLAARDLNHPGGLAACYTFGAPRVGDEEWVSDLKTPMYRLVNSADCVTMLPPGTEVVSFLGWLVRWIPGVGQPARQWLLKRFGGYLHAGNMRFLTNCPPGDYRTVRLLYSVSLVYRLKAFIIKKLPWRHFLADHKISVYRKKLAVVAENRN
ncbi:lipase family protein [Saccharospirillum salsuginis]|uniref:Fungal lipase-type domain-containing protein n=1 Tax=Saccharospirillum salsuginis TaxID=418750 RepID=A0A918K5I0_9GAMM|nr:lipase family protein [Saccharospirillum salsuginis]GGX47971.1 hypothetical protein GCM10007392_13560 [Saccharospirillum salsuginis]